MADVPDPIAIRHPKLPGEHSIVPRSTLSHWETLGWTEAKSPAAKADEAVAADAAAAAQPASPEGTTNPSKGG